MLTNDIIRLAEIRETEYVLSDEGGLYVKVMRSGRKTFGMQYRFAGKRKTLLLGIFPEMLIEQARQKRDEYKAVAKAGTDPAEARGIIYKLTEEMIRDAQPREKVYYLTDQNNLSVAIEPTGAKYFGFMFRFEGERHGVTLGHHPEISLEEARRRQKESQDKLSLGQRPVSYPREVQYRLTEEIVRNARPAEEDYRLIDQRGLYLQVRKITGSKSWGMQYDSPEDGRDRALKLGDWPDLSLEGARKKHERALALIAKGKDPADTMRIIEYKLTEEKAAEARPREKIYYLTDQRGLALEVRPTGVKSWMLRYQFHGRWRGLVLGRHPDISLNQARQIQEKVFELAGKGVDPATQAPLPITLTEGMARNAPAMKEPYTLYGADGLQLDVVSAKRKEWKLAYNANGESGIVSLGKYPGVSFADAQDKQKAIHGRLASGMDPLTDNSRPEWMEDIQKDEPPAICMKDYSGSGQYPYLIAYQRNRLRYLVYLDDRRNIFEVVDGAKGGDVRLMTDVEAAASLGVIRRELPPGDLKRVEEALVICELRIGELTGEKVWKPKQDAPEPEKMDMRRKEARLLALFSGRASAPGEGGEEKIGRNSSPFVPAGRPGKKMASGIK